MSQLPPALEAKIATLRVVRTNGQILVNCPAHEDGTPSLAIKMTSEGNVLLQCLAGETRVITRAGTKPIAELSGGDHELLVPAEGGYGPPVWRKAPIHSFGVQPLMKLRLTRFGAEKVIYATAEHRWFTQKRNKAKVIEVVTRDLMPGTRLRPIVPAVKHRTISPFGVAHGFTFGDGSVHTASGVCSVDLVGVKQALLPYFPVRAPMDTTEEGGVSRLRVDGLPKFFKALPSIDENNAYLYGFLAGYFAADGSIEGKKGLPYISSVDLDALQAVRDIATRLNIMTYPIQSATRRVPLPTGRIIEAHTIYKLGFQAKALPNEFFLNPKHRARWEGRSTATSQESWSVASVEVTDRVEEVFCATVDGVGAFALEDFILTGNCHGGCDTRSVLAAWDLSWPDILPERKREEPTGEWTPVKDKFGNNMPATAIYRYEDEKGTLLYEVIRVNFIYGGKTFTQRRPDIAKKSGWSWNLEGVRRVLYRLPKVLAAVDAGEEVILCEGEKDANTAESLGYVATCNSGGAGKFLPDMADVFKDGAHVLIVADADEPGRKHARTVKALIEGVGGIVRVGEPRHGKDLTDHVQGGGTLADLNIVDETEMPDLGMIDFNDLINGVEEEYDWLVPGLIERGERFILTGPEGLGKTSMLRQIATCIACGLHPFESSAIAPRKVVWFDAENSHRQNLRAFRPLGSIASFLHRPIPNGQFSFFLRPDGINLAKDDDAAWFMERLAISKPDLVIIGPWYRLFIGNPNDEEVARKVVATLDKARARYGFAVMIEAHSPHSDGFKANKLGGVRPVRPIGSSLLLRWPEFGMGLSFRDPEPGHVPEAGDSPILPGMPDPNYADFMPWRGARDERAWPQAVRRSNDAGNWPWLACEPRPTGDAMTAVRGSITRTTTYDTPKQADGNAWGSYSDGAAF